MTAREIRPFNKILVANRGEIAIRVFRACTELGIQTVAIYSQEDRLHLHRYKADEAYQMGKGKPPIQAYLDYDEIIALAVSKGVDAIHPGYGFLAENAGFAKACEDAGIKFIGPPVSVLENMGDKVFARHTAIKAGLPVIPGTEDAIETDEEALAFTQSCGYPVIVKAALGGGGRGMSIVHSDNELFDAMAKCRAEAQTAFGDPKIFIEKYLQGPKHIEIQILGDEYGNLVHLYERDCSIQRRHQKVVEIAPSLTLTDKQRTALFKDAIAICQAVHYCNAGTVEFLVDQNGEHYFIEVNPRIQVEHTITEVITGRDLVQCQIRVAEGYPLASEHIRIPSQSQVNQSGYCIQLRLTTEDPANGFSPDTGRITAFRPGEGFGIRLDAGSGFDGAIISPHYDSLLIKVCASALDFDQAAAKALRAIREFRIRGVKTNIPFLENVLQHPVFLSGEFDTTFIESHPELLEFKPTQDRANKLLDYLSELMVNGFPGIPPHSIPRQIPQPAIPQTHEETPVASEAYHVFQAQGAEGLSQWLFQQKPVLLTDTTFRDAHQSLLATRVRTYDLAAIAPATAHATRGFFSHEMWGGATFDVAYRFLHEDPWQRLQVLRQRMPGTLFQMLLRSGNAVGYTNYPDNVVNHFIDLAAKNGIDIFRIFDCLNWVEGLKPVIAKVAETGKIAEAAVCYSGDITDSTRTKFTLAYYLEKAKALEQAGAHILAIKDMAGLLKPDAARILITELKNALTIPVHLHTHDTSGNGVATLLEAAKAGVDVVDASISSLSGITSQPSLNALVYALETSDRATGINPDELQALAEYWEMTRAIYAPFECGLKAGSADVYTHEIPGGQYSNFRPQAISVGLGDRWEEVKRMYRVVNDMLGDIVKVTPSSKAVGDMALFMVQNDLTPEDVLRQGSELAYPDSFVSLISGMMGQPDGGFPTALQQAVLGNKPPITVRPGETLPDFDFNQAHAQLKKTHGRDFSEEELSSFALYPAVFEEYLRFVERFSDASVMETPTFLYGLRVGEEKTITIEAGKTLIVKLIAISELKENGTRQVFFELNGRSRTFDVRDQSAGVSLETREKADPANTGHIGAPMSGTVVELFVKVGDEISEGEKLLSTESMKMVNVVHAPTPGTVNRIVVTAGDGVMPGDLLIELG